MPPALPSEADTDRLLRALADSTRRLLLDRLRDHPGLTLGELLAGFGASRQALSKHLAALEGAGLVVTLWRGREKLHYLDPQPLKRLPARWMAAAPSQHEPALQALRQALGSAQPNSEAALGSVADALSSPGGVKDGYAAPAATLARQLAASPGPLLQGAPVQDIAALEAARAYLAATAQLVRQLVDGMPPDPAAYHLPESGGFSLAQHLWHLADLETLGWGPRFQRLLEEDRPHLPGIDGDRLAVEGRYQQRPWRGAARRFTAQRRRTLTLLARYDTQALSRPAVFAGRRSSAGDVLAALVAHDQEHRLEMAPLWACIQGGNT